jgi:hypothetical protein
MGRKERKTRGDKGVRLLREPSSHGIDLEGAKRAARAEHAGVRTSDAKGATSRGGAHPISSQSNQAPQSPHSSVSLSVSTNAASMQQPCNARSARLDPTRTRRIASCRQTPSHYSRRALAVEAGGTTRRIPAASECCQGKAGLRRWHGGHAAAVAGNRGADGGVWGCMAVTTFVRLRECMSVSCWSRATLR